MLETSTISYSFKVDIGIIYVILLHNLHFFINNILENIIQKINQYVIPDILEELK